MYLNLIQQKWQFLREVSFLIVRLIHSFHSCNSSQASQLGLVSPRSHIRYLNLKFYTISCAVLNLTQTYPAMRAPKPPSTYTSEGLGHFVFHLLWNKIYLRKLTIKSLTDVICICQRIGHFEVPILTDCSQWNEVEKNRFNNLMNKRFLTIDFGFKANYYSLTFCNWN